MNTALLLVIYLSFISLGLPDTLLGAAWPAMRAELSVSLDSAGAVSLIVSLGTVVSSLLGGHLLHRFGPGPVAFFSVLSTALALTGFSFAHSFPVLLFLAVPLGLGAGAVDAGLNNFVALHYKPIHMNFLHCFWGLGAMSGPAVISFWILRKGGWAMGYRSVAFAEFLLAALLGLSLPLWKRAAGEKEDTEEEPSPLLSNREALRIPGVKTALLSFFCYCSLELTVGLWASSYLVEQRGASPEEAALCASVFYGGIAGGRLLSGLLSGKLKNVLLIRFGQGLCVLGALLLLFPGPLSSGAVGLGLFGLGCAPIYPAMLQETPARFGRKTSQSVMGLQICAAYLGSTLTPAIVGSLAQRCSAKILPLFLLAAIGLMALLCEGLNRFLRREKDE